MARIALGLVALVGVLAMSGAALAQGGKKSAGGSAPIEADDCPVQALGLAAPMTCFCRADAPTGSVWGIGPYTADSNLCLAARHAGAVGEAGGAVNVTPRPGQSSYDGSTANGVTTSGWGVFGESFDVAATGGTAVANPDLPASSTMPAGVDEHVCFCSANARPGSVWGNGPYTADSDICTAAIHNGYIPAEGGEVYVLLIQGLQSYSGGDSNGLKTSDWGAYDDSITFDWNR